MNIFQETDGSYSMRRFLAFLSWIAGALLSFYAIPYAGEGWFVFLPAMALFGLSALMPLLTTLADIKTLAETIKGIK
jgi:hypothetical protein